jgi:hypothetical protein
VDKKGAKGLAETIEITIQEKNPPGHVGQQIPVTRIPVTVKDQHDLEEGPFIAQSFERSQFTGIGGKEDKGIVAPHFQTMDRGEFRPGRQDHDLSR